MVLVSELFNIRHVKCVMVNYVKFNHKNKVKPFYQPFNVFVFLKLITANIFLGLESINNWLNLEEKEKKISILVSK